MLKSGLAFHVHHDKLFEFCTDYGERVKYIREEKPKSEQELRLRLFKLIPEDRVPGRHSVKEEAYFKAGEAYKKAGEAYFKVWEAYKKVWEANEKTWEANEKAGEANKKAREANKKAREAYEKVWEAYKKAYGKEIIALHQELCPNCPFDKETIFTRKDKDGKWY